MLADVAVTDSSVCIQIENLVKVYGRERKRALDGVTLEIHKGEVFGLIGPNGAGKTTLMGCLLSLLRPSSGRVLIFGVAPDNLRVKQLSAFLPERPNFDAWMTARQFMHYHHMLARLPQKNVRQDVEAALSMVELDPAVWDRRVKKFSRGMLQRLGIAQMLIGDPQLCFLDEPGSGMDPLGANLLRSMLVMWKKKGVTVVLNSHHLDEVERVCDRVAFIKAGRIQQIEELSKSSEEEITVIVKCCSDEELPADLLCGEVAANLEGTYFGTTDHCLKFHLKRRQDKVLLVRALVERQVPVEEVFQERRGLEDLFIAIHKEEEELKK